MFNLMMKENLHSLNEIFKRNSITLNENFPRYLFHLNNLHIVKQKENLQLLQNFKNLKYLTLFNCQFEDKHLQHLNMLEELDFGCCDNLLGECFKEFKQLKTLQLHKLKLKDDSLTNLNNITSLEVYKCHNITGIFLQNCTQLIKLTYTGYSTDIITHINSLQNLKILCLTLRDDPNEGYQLNLKNLEELELNYSDDHYFEDADLINLPKLRTLWLFGNSNSITGSCFINLQNLQNLYISEFEGELKEENLQYLTNLRVLDCKVAISAYYLRNLSKLKELTFTPNDEFKEEYLENLTLLELLRLEIDLDEKINNLFKFTGKCLTNLINLTKLTIPFSKVEDKYLMELTKLKVLDVSFCETITGECLLNLNNLQRLYISETNIQRRYLQNLKNLKYLDIDNSNYLKLGNFLFPINQLRYFR
ncbi:hypothetical protein ABK040_015730 [Willaertia magna]